MSELAEAVRTGDPDRFWPTMAAAAAIRDRLWPVYAVNLHLARAPWASDQPILAEMRLQWWIDALGRVATGQVREADPAELRALPTEVAAQLATVAEARRAECWGEPFADTQDLMQFIDGTGGGVAVAAGLALGAALADRPELVQLGRAQGLAAYLRAAPILSARGRDRLGQIQPSLLAELARRVAADRPRLRRELAPAGYPAALAWAVLRRAARDPAAILTGRLDLSEFARRAILARLAVFGA